MSNRDRPRTSKTVHESTQDPMKELLEFPLMRALFGRRSRRFGLGMELPSGPLEFASDADPHPLSEREQALLIAAGTGVTGWNFGIPYGPATPDSHAEYSVRFTGRTAPTAAGIGTPLLFYTDDDGTYLTNTRDVDPTEVGVGNDGDGETDRIIAICREHTEQLSTARLDVPNAPGHVLEPNHWWANRPGSTLFMPAADASEQMLGILSLFVANGYLIADDEAEQPAGDLGRFVQSGLLDGDKVFPLSFLERAAYTTNCSEVSFIGHNIVLTMQAMGLGGLYFTGMNELSVLGAPMDETVDGLGFRFVENNDWTAPNPVGLDGVFEGHCPPYYSDMRAAVEAFVDRKFGPDGAYDPASPGPWTHSTQVKQSVSPYSEEMVDCLSEVAQYVYEKHGKFPGTIPTIVLPGFVQAHHIDTEYYDAHYDAEAYLGTHATHMERWHDNEMG
mgnify:CR=1 FL=1